MKGPHRRLSRVRWLIPCLRTAFTKKKGKIIFAGNSLLREMETPIHQLDPTHREVCCLPGAWVRDITRRIPTLVFSLLLKGNYFIYPLLLVQAGCDKVND